MADEEMKLEIVDVRIERNTNIPFVTLRAEDGRVFPILTRLPEAEAIKLAHEGASTPRPLTHELLVDILTACGARITKLVITSVQQRVFYGELHVALGPRTEVVSCRPSDGIALASRAKAPIYARAALLDEVGMRPDEAEAAPEGADELVDEFRKFIDEINPEDFA